MPQPVSQSVIQTRLSGRSRGHLAEDHALDNLASSIPYAYSGDVRSHNHLAKDHVLHGLARACHVHRAGKITTKTNHVRFTQSVGSRDHTLRRIMCWMASRGPAMCME